MSKEEFEKLPAEIRESLEAQWRELDERLEAFYKLPVAEREAILETRLAECGIEMTDGHRRLVRSHRPPLTARRAPSINNEIQPSGHNERGFV